MRDGWLNRSKQLFGQGMEQRTEFAGIPFVLPLLETRHILNGTKEFRRDLHELFPVFVRESEADCGVLLTFANPLYEPILLTVLENLRAENITYPALGSIAKIV